MIYESFKHKMMAKGISVVGNIKETPPKIIVPFSGGKDSQTCLRLACEQYKPEEVIALFSDTKYEHSITYNHVDYIVNKYKCNLIKLNAGSVEDVCIMYKRFPRDGSRHCTSLLKIRPAKFAYKYLSELYNTGFEVWYGLRSEESQSRKDRYSHILSDETYAPHEVLPLQYPKYLSKKGIKFRLPILNWSEEEVFKYLDGEENLLYKHGFGRVGCFPCLAGGEKNQVKAFQFDKEGQNNFNIAKRISEVSGKPVFTIKSLASYNNAPCMFCSI